MADRKGSWMQTHSGIAFWPMDPRPNEVDIVDIAHALSLQCRYNGHTRVFYSVAEHCILMAAWFHNKGMHNEAKLALLHDAAEAYVGDLIRPVKEHLPQYSMIEGLVVRAIEEAFDVPHEVPNDKERSAVKEADNRILLDERAALLGPSPRDWGSYIERLEPLGVPIQGMAPEQAKALYLSAFLELFRG